MSNNRTTGSLGVAAADNAGDGSLTYNWSATGTPSGPVTFSLNGSTAAANTTATFAKAGIYQLMVTATDPGGLSSSSNVTVTVVPFLTSIAVNPGAGTLNAGDALTLTAVGKDQFGDPLAVQPEVAWLIASGGGMIGAATGVFTAPATSGTVEIHASHAVASGTSIITVVSPPFREGEFEVHGLSVAGNTLAITAKFSVIGHTDRLQSCVDLAAGVWTDIATVVPQAGDGNGFAFVLDRDAAVPRCFYRIAIGR